ncbi:hypothetical protein RA307_09835 [Xanthobacteraceae bacterium Astr-EGSB]|uniref:hypothetical protein n=1 Tax=Astrobacterium formosum TaxID=3069710 RepID=UPI0027AEB0F6|nr:hypothetical protein [Xanthobacteraceae bacterium Astr-EGSB]
MSLARAALRIATLEALRPTAAIVSDTHPAGGPWPTLAGARVYDSRIDPVDDLAASERRPVIVIYTDEDNSDPAQKAGGPPYKRIVDLVVELSVIALGLVGEGEEEAYVVGTAYTDAELEIELDLLEAQARFALHYGPTGAIWRKLTGRKVIDIHSLPHRTSEEGDRLALRTVRIKLVIPDDCYDPAPSGSEAGNDRLPEPLRGVIIALAATSYGAKLAQGIAPAVPAMPAAVSLDAVALRLDVADPQGQPGGAVEAVADNLQGD